jgi:hypothetical protein
VKLAKIHRKKQCKNGLRNYRLYFIMMEEGDSWFLDHMNWLTRIFDLLSCFRQWSAYIVTVHSSVCRNYYFNVMSFGCCASFNCVIIGVSVCTAQTPACIGTECQFIIVIMVYVIITCARETMVMNILGREGERKRGRSVLFMLGELRGDRNISCWFAASVTWLLTSHKSERRRKRGIVDVTHSS